jgi:CRP-like cAMP-binding protein
MSDHESVPPPESDGTGTDTEQAAWEIATAESLRARGELAQAATWYRRAAHHLMEAGDDERALSIAKLAAELAALDDAGRPVRGAATESPAAPITLAPRAPLPLLSSAPPRPAPIASRQPSEALPVTAAAKSAAVSPLAAMVDEAVSHLDELPPAPLPSEAPRARSQRSYLPERLVEADRITMRLPALPLFAELPAERVRSLARQVGIVHYPAGELLCEAGAPEGPLLVLTEGAAFVGVAGQDGSVALVSAGDCVGEIAALYGGARTASVMAREPVEALAFAPSLVRALAREVPAFREALEEVACERMRQSLPRIAAMLRRFDEDERQALFTAFEMVALPEGSLLLSEGEAGEALYLVAGGEVELYGGDFGATRTHHARVGEALGVTAMLTGEPAGLSARAAREVLVARLPRSRVREVLAAHPSLADALGDVGVPGRGVVY